MTPDTELYYAIAVRRPNANPTSAPDGVAADHNERQRTKFPPRIVEVYASEAARDRAIRPVGREMEFVACDAGEGRAEGGRELAVGDVAGEEGFEAALVVVADALASLLPQEGPRRLIVNRIAYGVDGDGRPLDLLRLIPGTPLSEAVLIATSCAVWRGRALLSAAKPPEFVDALVRAAENPAVQKDLRIPLANPTAAAIAQVVLQATGFLGWVARKDLACILRKQAAPTSR